MISAIAAGLPLAGNEFGDTQTDGIAGPVGLLIIVLLVLATVLLIRNMSGRIKRLPNRFSAPDQPDDTDSDESTSDGLRKSEQVGDEPRKD